MRMLTNQELDLVAGGNSSSDAYDMGSGGPYGNGTGYGGGGGGGGGGGWQWVTLFGNVYSDPDGTIVVTGNSGYWWYTGSGGGGTGGGGGGSQNVENYYPDANDTPCVETSFAGSTVSTDRTNNAARAATDAIMANPNWTQVEYGAFIYELNGVVEYTQPFTDGSADMISFNTSVLPAGAHVLGIIHNQPYNGVDQRMPSQWDWDVLYNGLAGHNAQNGITIDSNLLMYILTDQDNKIRVYDNTDRTQTTAACSLN